MAGRSKGGRIKITLKAKQAEKHYIIRVDWLRAAVLGANDGILSTTSIVIGVAAASHERATIVLAAIAFWDTITMAATASIGYLFDVKVS